MQGPVLYEAVKEIVVEIFDLSAAAQDFVATHFSSPRWAQGAVSRTDAAFLYDMVQRTQPKGVIELGVASGVSTAFLTRLLATMPGVRLSSYDIAERFYGDPKYAVGQHLLDSYATVPQHVTLHTGVSSIQAAASFDVEGPVDLLFNDANHRHPWPCLDLLAWLSRLRPGAWVVLHDVSLPDLMPAHQEFGPKRLFRSWPGETVTHSSPAMNIGAIRTFSSPSETADALVSCIAEGQWDAAVAQSDLDKVIAATAAISPAASKRLVEVLEVCTMKEKLPQKEHSVEQGTEGALDSLQEGIAAVLEATLRENVTSKSSVAGVTITGNNYQSIRLGDKSTGGFRALRQSLLKGFALDGLSACDLGANLGEISRDLKRAGASHVDAYEYDKFFTQIGRYVTAYNGIYDVHHIAADISLPGFMRREYDVTVGLSAYAYIEPNYQYICSQTREMLIIETHEVGRDWYPRYVDRLTAYFPHWCCFGIVGHGATSVGKRRLWLTFSKKPLDGFYDRRAHALRGGDEGTVEVDLDVSSFGYLKSISALFERESRESREFHPSSAATHLGPRLALLEAELASGGQVELSLSGEAYWLSLLVGASEMVTHGCEPLDTSYARWLRRGLEAGVIDLGIAPHLLTSDGAFEALVKRRLIYAAGVVRGDRDLSREPVVTIFNATPDHSLLRQAHLSSVRLAGSEEWLCAPIIDGHHRIFFHKLLGASSCTAMLLWDTSYLRYLPGLAERSNYRERIIEYLTSNEVSEPVIDLERSVILSITEPS